MQATILILATFVVMAKSAVVPPQLTCYDEQGKPIDWFVSIKYPKLPDSLDGMSRAGMSYAYMTKANPTWTMGKQPINSTLSMIGRSLAPLYETDFKSNKNLGYIIINDECLPSDLASRAHAKMTLIFDDKRILKITHSVPKFPLSPSESKTYTYQEGQAIYGQSFICETYPISEMTDIGYQMLIAYPQLCDVVAPDELKARIGLNFDNMNQVLSGKRLNEVGMKSMVPLTTVGGETIQSFCKNTKFNADLYLDFLGDVQPNVFSTTWSNGVGTLDTTCDKTNNRADYNIKKTTILGSSFVVNKDHSKTAVLCDKNMKPVMGCFGDINRQKSQYKRGGCTYCITNDAIAQRMFDAITEVESCTLDRVAPSLIV